MRFYGTDTDPEVLKRAPSGIFSLLPTKKSVKLEHTASISAQGGGVWASATVGPSIQTEEDLRNRASSKPRGLRKTD
ncbi:hypothetical protein MMC15_001787 [Xylographa vitiligo]|nr:hypothetical protein [Xylographa vitiligo]